jgi:two-component sensor histidine kinase
MALSLSMAMHELCTNAVKYGALGAPDGRVHVSWSTLDTSSGLRLALRWEEHGGPLVSLPSRKGFGSRLIQEGLARELDGEARLIYRPQGVICTIDAPLS